MNLNSQQREEEEKLEVLLRLFITHMLSVCVCVCVAYVYVWSARSLLYAAYVDLSSCALCLCSAKHASFSFVCV